MRRTILTSVAAAAVIAGGLSAAPAGAVPTITLKQMGQTVKPVQYPYVEKIRSKRHYRHRGHRGHRWHRGNNVAPWIAGGLLGLGLYGLSQGYYDDGYRGYAYEYEPYYGYDGDGGYARCEATFRSFDANSGTYVGYDGIRRRCPYL